MKILPNYVSLLLILLLNSAQTTLFAQVKVENQRLSIEGTKLVIQYDLVGKPQATAKVCIEIRSTAGNKIKAQALSGDIGKKISMGKNKKIVWDTEKDAFSEDVELVADILVEEEILLVSQKSNLPKALALSTVLPFLGISKKGKPMWLLGVAAYGSLAGAYLLNGQANQQYQSYLAETNSATKRNELFTQAQSTRQTSTYLAYAAAGIWAVNLIWTIADANKAPAQKSKLQCRIAPLPVPFLALQYNF